MKPPFYFLPHADPDTFQVLVPVAFSELRYVGRVARDDKVWVNSKSVRTFKTKRTAARALLSK